jgi:hypothetical protein
MKNQYRINFIDSVINDLDNDLHVDGERLKKAIFFCEEAERIIQNETQRLIKKARKEMDAENKKLDAELANVEG